MRITINGEVVQQEYGASGTLEDLLISSGFANSGPTKERDLSCLVVSKDDEIITRAEFATTVIKENDAFEVLRFVGGG
ncbi:MAG: sulfur carrier protein ThiS [Candidatus Ancillula sp.]|jgi:thiamine biosynthesis protein ThiS|nr:sulfur carrier protein ThiS [Candidatus Ancillula sp.]